MQMSYFPIIFLTSLTEMSSTFTGNSIAGARLIRQTVSGLEVGTTYNVSVDLKAVVNPATALQVSCTFYMYHDSLAVNNLITQFSKVYSRSDNGWSTHGGTFAPASSSLELGWVLACSTDYSASIFNTYFDNALVEGEQNFLPSVIPHLAVGWIGLRPSPSVLLGEHERPHHTAAFQTFLQRLYPMFPFQIYSRRTSGLL